jgi:hypothetical protein
MGAYGSKVEEWKNVYLRLYKTYRETVRCRCPRANYCNTPTYSRTNEKYIHTPLDERYRTHCTKVLSVVVEYYSELTRTLHTAVPIVWPCTGTRGAELATPHIAIVAIFSDA